MNLVRITCTGGEVNHSLRSSPHRSEHVHPHPCKRTRQAKPDQASPRSRQAKQRRLRCDCGQLAVTVLLVQVGSDPQYTIHLPLCPTCLILERELHR
jgi:hypothetical protein